MCMDEKLGSELWETEPASGLPHLSREKVAMLTLTGFPLVLT